MERKTKVHAEDGRHDLTITREFELPVNLVYRAYTEAYLVEQWMGTNVLKLENKAHGGWHFQTRDGQGNVVFEADGTIHSIEPKKRIVRTFQMHVPGFDVQMEFLDFEPLNEETSKLTIHMVFRTVALRDQQLKLPFEYGLNMAHSRLEEIISKIK